MRRITFFCTFLFLSNFLIAQQYVGVGTNNPNAPLEILKQGAYEVLRVGATSNTSGYLSIYLNGAPKAYFGMVDNFNHLKIGTWNNSPGNILFKTGASLTRMTISANGKVGIGTTVPESMLDVNGAITLQEYTGTGTEGSMRYNGSAFEWHDGVSWKPFGGGGSAVWTEDSDGIFYSTTNDRVRVGSSFLTQALYSKFSVKNFEMQTGQLIDHNPTEANVNSTSSYAQYIHANASAGSTHTLYGSYIWTRNGGNGTKYGLRTIVDQSSTSTNSAFGIHAQGNNAGSSNAYGINASGNNTGSGPAYGVRATASGASTGVKYGLYSSVSGGGNTKYGVYTTASGSGSYGIYAYNGFNDGFAGYFDGRVQVERGEDASLTGDGILMIGTSTKSLVMDVDELQARSNSSASDLYLQPHGGDVRINGDNLYVGSGFDYNAKMNIQASGGQEIMRVRTGSSTKFLIDGAGDVMINTASKKVGYALNVDGKIIGEELRIENSSNWPDYVFAEEYKLRTLEEVEAHIVAKKHLPGIPSATVVEKEGILVGDMQKKMMEKIEELTLYVIDMNKRINELEEENEKLKKQ